MPCLFSHHLPATLHIVSQSLNHCCSTHCAMCTTINRSPHTVEKYTHYLCHTQKHTHCSWHTDMYKYHSWHTPGLLPINNHARVHVWCEIHFVLLGGNCYRQAPGRIYGPEQHVGECMTCPNTCIGCTTALWIRRLPITSGQCAHTEYPELSGILLQAHPRL